MLQLWIEVGCQDSVFMGEFSLQYSLCVFVIFAIAEPMRRNEFPGRRFFLPFSQIAANLSTSHAPSQIRNLVSIVLRDRRLLKDPASILNCTSTPFVRDTLLPIGSQRRRGKRLVFTRKDWRNCRNSFYPMRYWSSSMTVPIASIHIFTSTGRVTRQRRWRGLMVGL